jgi:hypothetical protein
MSCAWTFRNGELRFAWPERGLISVNSGSPYHWLLIRRGLLICASNLTHLSILDPIYESGSIVTRDLSSLVTASVILTSHQLHSSRVPMVDGYRLLDGLSHATTLELHAPLRYTRYEWILFFLISTSLDEYICLPWASMKIPCHELQLAPLNM